jgi:hypothetical protein
MGNNHSSLSNLSLKELDDKWETYNQMILDLNINHSDCNRLRNIWLNKISEIDEERLKRS